MKLKKSYERKQESYGNTYTHAKIGKYQNNQDMKKETSDPNNALSYNFLVVFVLKKFTIH